MTRTLTAKLALVLAWVVAVAWVLIGPAAPAQAAAPQLTVELTSLRTTGSGAKQTAVLTGRVSNVGAQPAFGVRVVLWRARDPITDPAVFTSVLNGQNDPWGLMLFRSPHNYFSITASDVSFDPGATAEFTVKGTLADLDFTDAGSIYPFGVQVRGTADASSNYQELARARTFYVTEPDKKLPLTSLVLLSAAPTKVRPNVFANEGLIDELTGRLDTLVELAGRPGVSWLVDPALIDEVTDLADGYQVVDGDRTRAGTGQQAAQAWLEKFHALPDERGARTLFANPDLVGAEANDAADVVSRAVTAGPVPELDDLPLLVLPHAGVAGPTTPAQVASADADALLVSTAGRGPIVTKSSSGSTLLRLAPDFTAGGPGDQNGTVQQQQRQFAEAVLGGGLIRLITSAADATADAELAPRWLRRTGIDDLLEVTPTGTATLTLPTEPDTLPAARFRQLRAMSADFAAYSDLVPDSELAADAPATLTRMASSWWIGDTTAANWVAAASSTMSQSAVTAGVTLSASARVLMSSRANEFPVTVRNELSEPIQVRVVFSSDNPQRLTIAASQVITVGPGQSETVNVRPEATANGLVNVTAGLQTGSGRPVGRTTRIVVEVTDLGMIGWIIVIVSGVVLVAATALRIRQVRRKQKEEEA
ncbi:DUF6049 family protein [Micropruina sp.]|uniref:DUF6049 family protein n=1 Tax=Micropruina sp. TaxID=2737536 RepID=UPI0039E24DFE